MIDYHLIGGNRKNMVCGFSDKFDVHMFRFPCWFQKIKLFSLKRNSKKLYILKELDFRPFLVFTKTILLVVLVTGAAWFSIMATCWLATLNASCHVLAFLGILCYKKLLIKSWT